MRNELLNVNVLASLASQYGGQGMPMIGSGHDDGIDGRIIEHASKVLHRFRRGPTRFRNHRFARFEQVRIDVGHVGDFDVVPLGKPFRQMNASSANADEPEHNLVVRTDPTLLRCCGRLRRQSGSCDSPYAGTRRRSEKIAAIQIGHGHRLLLVSRTA